MIHLVIEAFETWSFSAAWSSEINFSLEMSIKIDSFQGGLVVYRRYRPADSGIAAQQACEVLVLTKILRDLHGRCQLAIITYVIRSCRSARHPAIKRIAPTVAVISLRVLQNEPDAYANQ